LILSLAEHFLGFSLQNQYGYAIVSDIAYNTKLKSFDIIDRPSSEIFETEGYQLVDMSITGKGKLCLADRTFGSSGVRIFNVKSKEQETTDPIDVGTYPPIHITII